ncbi:Vitamin B12 transporter BtuB [Dyadobacter sp. CECT 9275]|uniref:Vitamin B12 transporter BtuB n=1 Tax=Dyadobacter helix TaxID=2822344 RepID=A0A916JAM1_9BACT|nr:SusC/RagA family TonB-linked outer membrane protein [Dyadobacter sp. CECT 9275]CAG4999841.1 Vitamin B12 transporter BtuB [Dyadobacter sp. CECT 9275]
MNKFTLLTQSLIAGGILLSAGLPAGAQLLASSRQNPKVISTRTPQDSKSLKSTLKELEHKYNVSFSYDRSTIADKKVQVAGTKFNSLQEELNAILQSLNLNYEKLSDKVYLILPGKSTSRPGGKPAPQEQSLLAPATASPETSLLNNFKPDTREIAEVGIRGTVTDKASGEGLPGVSILVKGTALGTTTNPEGKYSLTIPDANQILIFSYVGYKPEEVVINGRSTVDVDLEPDVKALKEVVVTALGISREKSSLGYAIGEIKSNQLQTVPHTNVLNALTGKVAGLSITSAGQDLNAEMQIVIRGKTSLAGQDSPLIVIDGIPVGSNANVVSDLNANNIESVSVLKGPSAAALYGSRAGSGVLLITTKKGTGAKKGIGVSFNTGYTASVPYHYIPTQTRFTTGRNGLFDESASQYWFGPEEGTPAIQWNSNGVATPLKFYPDNNKEYFQTGHNTVTDLSVQGVSDRGSYRLSVSDTRGSGNRPGMELFKNAFDLAANYKVSKNFEVSTDVHLVKSHSDNSPVQIGSDYPYESLFLLPQHVNINDLKDYWQVKNKQQYSVSSIYDNPWFVAYEKVNKFKQMRLYGNIKLDYKLTSDLSLMGRISHSNNNLRREHNMPLSYTRQTNGYYFNQNETGEETNADALLTYKKDIGAFSVNVSVGGNALYMNGSSIAAGGTNLVLPGLFTVGNVNRNNVSYGSSLSKKVIYSAYGVASVGYKDMAYLDVTGRNDWSSTLPANNRSYFYPSASLSLLLSNMFQLPTAISMLKVRAGWAQVGKDTNPYALDQYLSSGTFGGQVTYARQGQMPNVNLKPENAESTEFGFDVSVLKRRLGLNFTYYTKANKNQILNVTIPGMTGYSAAQVNAGIVENRGVEIELRSTPVQTRDFSWDLNLNFTRDRSKLTKLADGMDTYAFWESTGIYARTKVGETIGDLYGYDVRRVEDGPYKGWTLLDAAGKTVRGANMEKIGNVISDFMMGIQTTVSYKKLSLTANFDWRQGGDYYSMTMLRMARSGNIENWHNGISSSTFSGILGSNSFGGNADMLASEIKSKPEIYRDNKVYIGGRTKDLGGFPVNGRNNGAFFPGVIANPDGTYKENFGGEGTVYVTDNDIIEPGSGWWDKGTDMWIYDASYVKLREAALSYTLPTKLADVLRAQNLSLSLFARNLLLWTKAKNDLDPEVAFNRASGDGSQLLQGFDRWNAAPWTASFGLKLSAQF